MAYVAFPIPYSTEETKPINCHCQSFHQNHQMADLSSQRHWSCEDCNEVKQKRCCCCNCPCHANFRQIETQTDLQISNEAPHDNDKDTGSGNEEERLDMFEWMARERLNNIHAKREAVIHEYSTREPLQPEVVHQHFQPQMSESRNYLNAIHIVKNMKAKWEAMTEARNPPLLPEPSGMRKTFIRPTDMFQGALQTAKKTFQIAQRSEPSHQNNRCSTGIKFQQINKKQESSYHYEVTNHRSDTPVELPAYETVRGHSIHEEKINTPPMITELSNEEVHNKTDANTTIDSPPKVNSITYFTPPMKFRESTTNVQETTFNYEEMVEIELNEQIDDNEQQQTVSLPIQDRTSLPLELDLLENIQETESQHEENIVEYSIVPIKNEEINLDGSIEPDSSQLPLPLEDDNRSTLIPPEEYHASENVEQNDDKQEVILNPILPTVVSNDQNEEEDNRTLRRSVQFDVSEDDHEDHYVEEVMTEERPTESSNLNAENLPLPPSPLGDENEPSMKFHVSDNYVQENLIYEKQEVILNPILPPDLTVNDEVNTIEQRKSEPKLPLPIEDDDDRPPLPAIIDPISKNEQETFATTIAEPEEIQTHKEVINEYVEDFQPIPPVLPPFYHEENQQNRKKSSLEFLEQETSKPEMAVENPNQAELEEFKNFKLKRHEHRQSLKVEHRSSLKPRQSVEGLLPATSHPPQSPALPDPIPETPRELEEVSENQPWYSKWFSNTSTNNKDEYNQEEIKAIPTLELTISDIPVAEVQTEVNTRSLLDSTEAGFLTGSSIALEIDGHHERRASPGENQLILNELAADYDETVVAEYESKMVTIHKSKSQINMSTDELKMVVKSLSKERIRTANDDSPSKDLKYEREFHICHKCQKIVKPGDATFQFQNDRQSVWHRKCFVCTTCQQELGLKDHLFFDQEPYCYDHYVIVARVPKCHGCHEFIFDPTYTKASGHFWHKEHFICQKCEKPLVDTKYVLVNGRVYCFTCHQKDFVRICKSCVKTILPHESYVQSGDYFWHSNDSCLHCETCKRSLVGRSFFFRKAGHLYCNRYCALERGPPV